MRLVAVPLARLRPGVNPITTFTAQRASNAAQKAIQESNPNGAKDQKALPLSTRLLNKASAFWIDLGRTDQKSTFDWKRRTFTTGERLMDRIEYQEWALKGIDPAIGPKIIPREVSSAEDEAENNSAVTKIPLLYPASLISPSPLLDSLKTLTDHRTPHHYRRFWICVIGMPSTIPFALIPVIPNLPFFYLVYRAWSHWKAYKSSSYLSALIGQGRIEPTESKELDEVFSSSTIEAPKSAEKSQTIEGAATSSNAQLILQKHHIDLLMERLKLPESAKADLGRARLQIERSLAQGKIEELEKESH